MKKLFLLSFLMLLPMLASADPVLINGIYYNLIPKTKQAEVTSNSQKYYGAIVIPESVTYEGVNYSVTSIDSYAFNSCASLASINIPNSVTSIGASAFMNCFGLTSITIPNSVTNIENYAFTNCPGLTSITIGNNVTSIGVGAFSSTAWYDNQPDGLVYAGKVAYKYKGDMAENTKIILNEGTLGIAGSAFSHCFGLTSVSIPNSVKSIGIRAFQECTALTSVTIPNSVTSIGYYAFFGCSGLTSINIGNSVTSIDDSAFEYCSSLTSVHISDMAAWCNICFENIYSNPLIYAHYLYLNGNEVKDVAIPSGVTSIGNWTFMNCLCLTSVTIPNSVTSIGGSAFSGCSSLSSVTIPNSVTSIAEYAFNNCSNLESATISNNVTTISNYLFQKCSHLTSINIPDGVTSIGNYAFDGCYSLSNLTIPQSVTTIGEYAFQSCRSLATVTIPQDMQIIKRNTFTGCRSLKSITIPAKVEYIYQEAFYGCGFEEVKVLATTPPFAYDNTFSNYNIPLYVPEGSVSDYQSTIPWSKFSAFKTLSGEEAIKPKCATPTISYGGKKLTFNCEIEGVEYVYEIKDADIKQGYDNEVSLSATYEISVYATKAGYENSDVATAILVWGNASFTETTPEPSSVRALTQEVAALITSSNGIITVSCEAEGQPISVYAVNGQLLGTSSIISGQASVQTPLQSGSVAIVKIGDNSVKVLMK